MPTFSESPRNQDDPIIIRLDVMDLETEEWLPDKLTLKAKPMIAPKKLLEMQNVEHETIDIDTLCDYWAVLLDKTSGPVIAEHLKSDTTSLDMGQLNTAFKWAIAQLGLTGDEDPT